MLPLRKRKSTPTTAQRARRLEAFAVTTFGVLGPEASAFMFTMGKLLSAHAEAEEERWAVRELLGLQLQVTLKRGGRPVGLPGSEDIEACEGPMSL